MLDVHGKLHTGLLNSGMASLDLPIFQCAINYLGTTADDEQKLIELRATFKTQLNNMLIEVRQIAARQDALFEQ